MVRNRVTRGQSRVKSQGRKILPQKSSRTFIKKRRTTTTQRPKQFSRIIKKPKIKSLRPKQQTNNAIGSSTPPTFPRGLSRKTTKAGIVTAQRRIQIEKQRFSNRKELEFLQDARSSNLGRGGIFGVGSPNAKFGEPFGNIEEEGFIGGTPLDFLGKVNQSSIVKPIPNIYESLGQQARKGKLQGSIFEPVF